MKIIIMFCSVYDWVDVLNIMFLCFYVYYVSFCVFVFFMFYFDKNVLTCLVYYCVYALLCLWVYVNMFIPFFSFFNFDVICVCVCVCVHVCVCGHKWYSKMSKIYMLSWKQCALLVVTTIALWQYAPYAPCLACWALFGSFVPAMCNHISCAQMHESPQSHCGDNRDQEGTLFSW